MALRTSLLLLCVMAALPLPGSAAPSAGAPDPHRPSLLEKLPAGAARDPDDPEPPRGSRGYDVLHYDLDLRFDVAAAAVSGAVGIDLRAVEGPLARVRLDLVAAMQVAGVTWLPDGEQGPPVPLPWDQGADSLAVALPQPLAAGAAGRLAIAYAGRPPRHGALYSGLMFREYEGVPVVASVSEPWSAHSWWPCKDVPADKATLRLAATVPDTLPWPLRAIGNGRLVDEFVPERGWRTFVWREDYPISPYLVSVAIGEYASWSEDCPAAEGTVPLSYHVFPPKEEAGRHDLAPTCEMLRLMEEIAGPWPFAGEKYAQSTIVWGGAMENQTATSFGAFLLTGDGRFERFVMHELAHQWFGDSVGPARWRDIWLNEGFASYCEALWAERRGGRAAYFESLRGMLAGHEDLFAGEGIMTDPSPILPNALVYDKGAWLLHMLRGLVRDEAFFPLLRGWSDDPARRHGSATTEDFVAHVGAGAGPQAAAFLEPWLRTDAVPVLRWRWEAGPAVGGGARVRLEVEQLQESPFILPLPIHLHAAGATRIERALLTGPRAVFTWTLPQEPDSLVVDPERWLLWRAAPAPQPRLRVLAVRPNPAGPDGAAVEFALGQAAIVTARLFDARGRRLGAWDLGLVEPAAAGDPPLAWRLETRDAGGHPLPAGVYWVELVAVEGGRAVARLTLLR